MLRKHPDCGPEEVALGKLGLHLNFTVREAELTGGSDPGGLNRVDDIAGGGSVPLTSIERIACALSAVLSTPNVDVTALQDGVTKVVPG